MMKGFKDKMIKGIIFLIMIINISACNNIKNTFGNHSSTSTIITSSQVKLGNITIKQVQTYFQDSNIGKVCNANIYIFKNGIMTDSIKFKSIESLGGSAGISKTKLINNHAIISKMGDYDGRTIIINKMGEIHNIIGGENYWDKLSNILFTKYESDIGGFAIFDLNNDKIIFKDEEFDAYPKTFYKIDKNKYIIQCFGYESDSIENWLFTYDSKKIAPINSSNIVLNKKNELHHLKTEDINCNCDTK